MSLYLGTRMVSLFPCDLASSSVDVVATTLGGIEPTNPSDRRLFLVEPTELPELLEVELLLALVVDVCSFAVNDDGWPFFLFASMVANCK